MNGHGMAPATPSNVTRAFAKLAPADEDPEIQIPQPGHWRPTHEQLLAALPRLKDGKGHDAGGWSHEAVISHLNSSACRLPFVQWLADTSASSCAQRKQLWSATRLVMLNKHAPASGEPGIRPILMSMTFRKIASMAAMDAIGPTLAQAVASTQYGTGTRNGALLMHAKLSLTQWHQEDEPRAFAQLDISNAFGSLAREHLPALLAEIAPEGYPASGEWLEHHLFSQLDVLIPGDEGGGPNMQRRALRQGLPQGDPLSAVVFGACLATICKNS